MEEKYPLSDVDFKIVGKAYIDGGLREVAISISNRRIVSISKPSLAPSSIKKLKLSEKEILLPGMVDIHVHFRDLKEKEKEDWFTGSLSALSGGVTVVGEMPNNIPFINNLGLLRYKEDIVREKTLVDYCLYMGFPANLRDIRYLKKEGVAGIKVYPEDMLSPNFIDVLRSCEKNGILVIVHPEDPLILRELSKVIKKKTLLSHGIIRHPVAEIKAISNLISLCNIFPRLRLHFTHVTLRRSIEKILIAKGLGFRVSFDVTIHHMLLTENALKEKGGISKVNPPLRSIDDRDAVFNFVKNNVVDAIVTDHAPHRISDKIKDNYEEVPSGFPGVEIALPILLTLIKDRRLPLEVLDLYSKKPAKILGINRGEIKVGNYADLVVVDTSKEWKVKPELLRSKAKFTPFEESTMKAYVKKVFLRGNLVYDSGNLLINRGFGKNACKLES